MTEQTKHNKILDALQLLLENKNIETISVREIAQTAGIGKASIYHYFPSKDAILEALIERNYQGSLNTAKCLAEQTTISCHKRLAILFHVCRDASNSYIGLRKSSTQVSIQEKAYIHHKFIHYLISELTPIVTEILKQGIQNGELVCESPEMLAELILIIITVKLDNSLSPCNAEALNKFMHDFILLLEKGTDAKESTLDFLTE
uniref:TetR/AcrR family transcriptional regulator n=1 Tax=Agathobacter sp. TaxID=2021311 RepID=UPI004056562D